jgi:hypothetical protein
MEADGARGAFAKIKEQQKSFCCLRKLQQFSRAPLPKKTLSRSPKPFLFFFFPRAPTMSGGWGFINPFGNPLPPAPPEPDRNTLHKWRRTTEQYESDLNKK